MRFSAFLGLILLAMVFMGGFIDDGINQMLDVDGRIESAIGLVDVGSKL